MTDKHAEKESERRKLKGLPFRLLLVAVIAVVSGYLLFRILLLTDLPSGLIGDLLSGYVGRKVTVAGFTLAGGAFRLTGIRVGNPPGFSGDGMLSVRSLSVAPDPLALLTLKKRISRLEVDGLRLNLEKNAGGWNFSGLADRFKSDKKEPPGELFIGRLSIRDASLGINGHSIDRLGMTIDGLSTKGTTETSLLLTARDQAGNPLRLTASGRMGPSPSYLVRLHAPLLSMTRFRDLLPPGSPLGLERAYSSIDITARFGSPVLDAKGVVGFRGVELPSAGGARPLGGRAEFSAGYDTGKDELLLDRASLAVNGLLRIRGRGSMERVRKEGRFRLGLSHDRIEMGDLAAFLPDRVRSGMDLKGTVDSSGLFIEGTRREGITACGGKISIRSALLDVKDRPILRNGGADLALKRSGDGWILNGRLFTAGKERGALIESLDTPLTAGFTHRFRPVKVEFPAVAAVVAGGRLTGSFRYFPQRREPFSADCSIRNLPLVSLNRFLPASTSQLSSGAGSATARLSGLSPAEFKGRVSASFSSAAGTVAGRKLSIRNALFVSRVGRGAGVFAAGGGVKITGGVFDGKHFSASFDHSLAAGKLELANAELVLERGRAFIKTATVRLPSGGEGRGGSGIPIAATLSGAEYKNGDLALGGLRGETDCRYFSSGADRRMEGGASFTVGSISYQGRQAASLAGRAAFGGPVVTVKLGGECLGGSLDASIRTSPFGREKETTFSARLREMRMERLLPLLPEKKGPRPEGGSADLSLEGSYGRTAGIRSELSVAGRGISLRGDGNRTLVAGVAIKLDSSLSGGDLLLREAVLSREGGALIRLRGDMRRFATADREGKIVFSMSSTPLNSLIDAFANALPRNLQEAVGGGDCLLDGDVTVKGGRVAVDGGLSLQGVSMEIPSQKVLIREMEGRVPFSLVFPRREPLRKPKSLSYSRENYPELLRSLAGRTGTGSPLRIGGARFGALDIGEITLNITAGNGSMEISPLRVSLYGGYLTGSGYLQYGNGFRYGADLLLHDLSLRDFCDGIPKIKGYMSGRVDGVVSILNLKGGVEGVAGYVDLWTRGEEDEEMLVSKEFLQKLAGKKLRGFLFRNDRPYDNGEIISHLQDGYLTFERLDISHTNFLGMKDLSVSVAPVQNRIAIGHLLESIREAAARGKGKGEGEAPPVQTDLKWLE